MDVERRKARLVVEGITQGRGEPILNPITGKEHRPRISIVDGFEYVQAEIGRGWTNATGPVRIELADTYGQFRGYPSEPKRHRALSVVSDAALESLLRRDRVVVIAALAAVTAIAWGYLLWLADDMRMGGMDMTGFRTVPAGRGLMMPVNEPWVAKGAERLGRFGLGQIAVAFAVFFNRTSHTLHKTPLAPPEYMGARRSTKIRASSSEHYAPNSAVDNDRLIPCPRTWSASWRGLSGRIGS